MSKHHFVPKLILKRFKAESGELWYFDRSKPTKPIISRNPDSIFYVRNLNTLADGSVSREDQFAQRIDTPFHILLERIEREISDGLIPKLTVDNEFLIASFVYYQFKRHPTVLKELISWTGDKGVDEDDVAVFDDIHQAINSELIEDGKFVHDLRANLMASQNPKVVRMILQRGFCLVRNLTTVPLIIGSKPVGRCQLTLVNPRSKATFRVDQLSLPVSKDLLLLIGPSEIRGCLVCVRKSAEIRAQNKLLAQRSSMIAGPLKSDIQALARQMIEQHR